MVVSQRQVVTRAGAYAFAAAAVALCALVRWALNPLLEDEGLYLAFMIPVAASAYFGGAAPGLMSAVLSAAIAKPVLVSAPVEAAPSSVAHLFLFVAEAGGVVLLMCKLQRSRDQARRALAAAEASRRAAEDANGAKEAFVARLSHEWRGPLNILSGWLWQFERLEPDRDFIRRATASMRRAVDTQSRLVGDLLDYSRGSHGKLAIQPERLAIREPIERAVESVAAEVERKRLRLVVDHRLGATRVWGDRVRLQQVFSNLLQNAAKFTPTGGAIYVQLRTVADYLEVTVSDNGVGIAPEALPQIFQPFQQGDTSRDVRRGGLGLGLSIARELVELHGGSISASSPGLDGGSSFRVCLPLAVADHAIGGGSAFRRHGGTDNTAA